MAAPNPDRLEHCLEQIDRHNVSLRALITVDAAGAREQADAIIGRERDSGWSGVLGAMPMVVKDNIDTAGMRTTSGSRFFADNVPNRDAPVVSRLRAAGACIVAKANLHEFAFGVRTTSPVGGQCLNPWDVERIPGGSSGGSAVAVATGMCVAALGSDTGGSIRLPAAMCGISGLRPTVGRVPNTGCTPVCPSQDAIGPMARRVTDVARVFAVIAGFDADDPFSADVALENFLPGLEGGVAGLRLGIPRQHYFDGCDEDVATAVLSAARTLERQGARLVDVDVAGAADAQAWSTTIIYADACAFHRERLQSAPETFDEQVYTRMRMGLNFTGVDYSDAVRARAVWRRTLEGVFDRVDLLVSPTVPSQVPAVADAHSLHEATRAATRNTYAGAFGQLPGLSIPCGFDATDMPIGMQLEAAWWREPTLLRAGAAYQSVSDWHLREPAP